MADFKGHTDTVTCCALAVNGRLVVSCSEDCTVKVSLNIIILASGACPTLIRSKKSEIKVMWCFCT